jgi:predicted trehalose synthase
MKDVAGMLRCFDYALHATLLCSPRRRRHPVAAPALGANGCARRTGVHRRLRRRRRRRPASGAAAQRDGLLELFLLEKAMHELNYELEPAGLGAHPAARGLIDLLEARA